LVPRTRFRRYEGAPTLIQLGEALFKGRAVREMSHLLTGLLIVCQTGILPLTGPQESAEQKRQQPPSLRAQRARLRLHLLYPLATRG
jgi:hypothetical protein